MVEKRELEIILSDQIEELEGNRSQKYCFRKEEELIDLDSPQAQVVIGVRRSGKSTLCFNALERAGVKYAYVNFDDERLAKLQGEDLNDLLEILYKINGDFNYLFLDEIQNVDEWYLFVNRLLRKKIHVIITGSNAKLLSGELATHLTGRSHTISLFPFSFKEYCELNNIDFFKQSTKEIGLRRNLFDKYLKVGGFPELSFIKNEFDYIDELVNNIIKRDIQERHTIQFEAAFEDLSQHLLNEVPCIVVDSKLSSLFGIKSDQTTKNYISYLKQAYLLLEVKKYSAKSRVRLVGEKAYAIDVALMNKRSNAFSGENLGWRLETIVLIELLRECKSKGLDVYYYSERSGECDFVVCRGRETLLAVQVSYDISDPKTYKREIAGLMLAKRKIRCERLLLITDHIYDDIIVDETKIAIRPAYDFIASDWL